VAEAVRGCDIVTTVTADKAYATILTPEMIEPGMHLNAVGGDCPGKTELHREIVERARVIVEYDRRAASKARSSRCRRLADHRVLAGGRRERPGASAEQVTLFDSVGFAIETTRRCAMCWMWPRRWTLAMTSTWCRSWPIRRTCLPCCSRRRLTQGQRCLRIQGARRPIALLKSAIPSADTRSGPTDRNRCRTSINPCRNSRFGCNKRLNSRIRPPARRQTTQKTALPRAF
jgi:hypothetical protein